MAALRIEAGLMVSGAEFVPDVDAMEAGLGFAVDFKKDHFIGRAALERNTAAARRKLVGLIFKSDEHPAHGDPIFKGRNHIGEIEVGRLDGQMKRLKARITDLPFLDAKREKPRA